MQTQETEKLDEPVRCTGCNKVFEFDTCIEKKTYVYTKSQTRQACPDCEGEVEEVIQCTLCNKYIDGETEAFYPLMAEEGEEESDYEDSPFCQDCTSLGEDEIIDRLHSEEKHE